MVSDNKTASRRETGDAVPKGTRNLDNSIVVADTMKGKAMSINVDLHMNNIDKIEVRQLHNKEAARFAVVELKGDNGHLLMFLYDVAQVDRLASTFESLAREVREIGWPTENN